MKRRNRWAGHGGFALVVAFSLTFVIALLAAAVFSLIEQEMFAAEKARDFLKARIIAEAGANLAYNAVKYDYDARNDSGLFPVTPFGGSGIGGGSAAASPADGGTAAPELVARRGSFALPGALGLASLVPLAAAVNVPTSPGQVSGVAGSTNTGSFVTTFTDKGSNVTQSLTVGTYGKGTARVRLDMRNFPSTRGGRAPGTPPTEAFSCILLAGAGIDWSGCGFLTGANSRVHSNGPLLVQGNGVLSGRGLTVDSTASVTVKGSATISAGLVKAPSIVGGSKITGTQLVAAVSSVAIPDIDLAPYYQCADKAQPRQVYSGKVTISSGFTPPGGVMWVDGELSIPNGRFTGCFIATGDIKCNADSVTATNGYPILISRDKDVSMQSQTDARGLIYTKTGDVKWTGGGRLTGSIICAGNVQKGGNSDLTMMYGDSTPATPGTSTAAVDRVVITAWQ